MSPRATDLLSVASGGAPAGASLARAPALGATIVLSDSALRIGDTATVTITFDAPVDDLLPARLSAGGGVLSGLSSQDNQVWTATLTPAAGVQSTGLVITLDLDGLAHGGDVASGSVESDPYDVDTVRPTLAAAISISDTALSIGETATVTFVFTEKVAGFDTADVSAPNATLSNLSSSDNGFTWTATLTPDAGSADATNVLTLDYSGIVDAAGNAGSGTASSGNYAVDTVRPTVAITSDVSSLKAGGTATITFTFSEDPGATFSWNGASGDVTVSGGTLGPLSGSGLTRTAVFTPTAGVNGGTASITVAAGSYADAAGNTGLAGVTPALSYDTLAPAAPTLTLSAASDTGASDADAITADNTPTFVGTAESGATVRLYDGATLVGSATATDGAWSITSDALAEGAHSLTATATDAAGNVSAATAPLAVNVDVTAPTATITLDDDALAAGETAAVTITFSEAVTGFTLADLTAPNGTLSNLGTSDDIVWTATLTPAANVSAASNTIVLGAGAVSDLAGNTNAAASSAAYAVDTLPAQPQPDPEPQPPAISPATPGADSIAGDAADNRIDGGEGDDQVAGGAGADSLDGGAGDDVLQGNTGADSLSGGEGADVAYGGQGDDFVHGNTGDDRLFGDLGDDIVHGGQGLDIIQGGQGADILFGDKGDDVVRGGQGDDLVFGGDGDDFLSGDRGSDTLVGGAGADTFHSFADAGLDLIADFNQAEGDRLQLEPGAAYTVAQQGADTVVTLTGGAQVILAGVQLSSLADGWILA